MVVVLAAQNARADNPVPANDTGKQTAPKKAPLKHLPPKAQPAANSQPEKQQPAKEPPSGEPSASPSDKPPVAGTAERTSEQRAEEAKADAAEKVKQQKADAAGVLSHALSVQATSVGSDVLQAVGQVVLKKAVRAGWAELSDKLSNLAGCDEKQPLLVRTCSVLGKARIEDLISSPRTLLDAFTADLLEKLTTEIASLSPEVKASIAGLLTAWAVLGTDSVATHIKPWLKKQLSAYASAVDCPASSAEAVAWVLGECYANATGESPLADLSNCDFDERLKTCGSLDAGAKTDVKRVAEIAVTIINAVDNNAPAKTTRDLSIQLFFEWTKLADSAHKDLLDHLETILLGLSDQDWTRAVIGIGQVAATVNTKSCDEDKHQCAIGMKLVRVVGAVGQFAQTYSTKTDPTAAREKVIEDLVTSLVDRSDRDHGAVISLGGALGMFGGVRANENGYQAALPVRLTLGVGLQTYRSSTGGLHVSLDAFDLGQYVTYSSNTLDVESPDVKSVVIAGATIGYWFSNRETPMFVAAHASASPFVRTMDGKITYEAGLMFGVYVPLLDFN